MYISRTLFTLLAVLLPQVSQAGTIYTTRASYDAAVVGLSLSWSEDFEGFEQGVLPIVPTIIGNGSAEIAKAGGTASIIASGSTLAPSGSNEWVGVEGGFGETIQGLAGASLGVNAIGFDYFSERDGIYNFHHASGVDSDLLEQPGSAALFVGWVGSGSEVLDFVNYTPSTSAHILDDIVAHVVPEPSTLILTALALLSLGMTRRRRRG